MKDWSVKKKIGGLIAFILFVSITCIVISILSLTQSVKYLSNFQDETVPLISEIGLVRRNIVALDSNLCNFILSADEKLRNELKTENQKLEKDIDDSFDMLEHFITPAEMNAIRGTMDDLLKYRSEIEACSLDEWQKAEKVYLNNFRPERLEIRNQLAAASSKVSEDIHTELSSNKKTVVRSIYFIVILLVLGILITLYFVKVLLSLILQPIREIQYGLHQLSEGNLACDIKYESKDEFGNMCDDMRFSFQELAHYVQEISRLLGEFAKGNFLVNSDVNFLGDFHEIATSTMQFKDKISSAMLEMQNTSMQVTSASDQVANSSQALAQGATEQASSIQQLSASIMEVNEQINENAKRAIEANELSQRSGIDVSNSNDKMTELSNAMDIISQKSNEIEKIIKTIEDIAFQTNILALNAAVEAARAGSAGKGFAVVADEVRNLAAKSSEASKNTASLIADTAAAVTNGVQLTKETADALSSVMENAAGINQRINEIASVSQEQATVVSQISQGVEQISAVVQTNSATSEESAATAEELSAQAGVLKDILSQFRI